MKSLVVCLALLASGSVFAKVQGLEACDAREVATMKKEILEKKAEGLTNASLMKNKKGEIVGYFATDKDQDIYAEVCEYVEVDGITVARDWYYWESEGKADPAVWTKNSTYVLMQDEGIAEMKVLKTSKTGNITVEFSVVGWGDDSKEVILRNEIVEFVPVK